MSEPTWFLRNKGQVTGPFTRTQLESLRNRGLVNRFSEVSTDRVTWSKAVQQETPAASSVEAVAATQAASPDAYDVAGEDPESSDPREAYSWYYAQGKDPQGPVRYSELRQLAASGQITTKTKVWNESMTDWLPAGKATDFSFGTASVASAGSPVEAAEPHAQSVTPAAVAVEPLPPSQHPLGPMQPLALSGFLVSLGGWITKLFSLILVVVVSRALVGSAVATVLVLLLVVITLCDLCGLILSALAMSRISRVRYNERGIALAISGFVLAIIGLFFCATFWIIRIVWQFE